MDALTDQKKSQGQVGLERTAFDLLGYSAPMPLADSSLAESARYALEDTGAIYTKNPHTTMEPVRALLRDKSLIAQINSLCGSGFRLWRSACFRKVDGTREIGWHHDKHFENGTEPVNFDDISGHFSVFFGLTDVVQKNGMLELVTGSHISRHGVERDTRPFFDRPASAHILSDLPTPFAKDVRPILIPAGSFLIFHSALFHRSLAHTGGDGTRLGLAVRLAASGRQIPEKLAQPEDIMAFPPPAETQE